MRAIALPGINGWIVRVTGPHGYMKQWGGWTEAEALALTDRLNAQIKEAS